MLDSSAVVEFKRLSETKAVKEKPGFMDRYMLNKVSSKSCDMFASAGQKI